MILILTMDEDLSSDIVIDWLRYYNAEFLRINTGDLINNPFLINIESESKLNIYIDDVQIKISDVGAIWFRKFGFFSKTDQARNIRNNTSVQVYNQMEIEMQRVRESLCYIFKDAYWLTNYKKVQLNKPAVLKEAMDCGFKIPRTFIVNTKKQLKELYIKYKLITKSVKDPTSFFHEGEKFSMFTKIITEEELNLLPDTFLPSLIQEYEEKKWEIRTFYLEGKCFSMAIFSQSDEQTQVDFRKYNYKNPNRFLPYQLEEAVENKIDNLMKKLGLNTGSIDFIVNKNNELIFLEINPTGQFGMVDYPCNYGLHDKVAQLLIRKDEENRIGK